MAMVNLEALLTETREAPPCGPNLEHDLAFFALDEAASGKPEQRLGDAIKPAEDPNWPKVIELAQDLFGRTKDLRVAVHLTRALTRTEGIPGLATGLGLIHGLLNRYWDQVYPLLEADQGGDPTERLNALAPLANPETVTRADAQTVLTDLRDTNLVNSREHGQLQVREVEIALGRLAPPRTAGAHAPKALGEIHGQIAAAFATDRTVPTALREARERVHSIQTLVAERVGADRGIDLKPLAQCIESVLEACDAALGTRVPQTATPEAGSAAGQAPSAVRPVIDGEIRTREDAVRVLDLVCSYLERHEPSNPAPLFIRRAQRLMTKNFIEIVKDLMPDSLSNLEKLAGEAVEKKK
jgi:type VI secretion system protein ImpA